MFFELTDAQSLFVKTASEIAKTTLAPAAAAVDRESRFPAEGIKALEDAGLLGLCVPTAAGGKGQPPRVFAAVTEELGAACASTAMIYVMHVTAAQAVQASTTLANRDRLLREMATGKHLTTLAFSEKGSRSQFWAPVSQCEEKDGGFVTSAYKSWVTSANHAASYVSSCQKPGAASPFESTIYLARPGQPGLRIAGGFDGLGLRGNDSAPVSLEGYRFEKDDLVSEQGAGATTMMQVVLPWFSIGTAALGLGLCKATMAATAAHLSGTGFEHTTQQLRDLPTLRERLARMSVRAAQARSLLAQTAAQLETPDASTPLYVLQSRIACLEAAMEVTDLGMKACGGAAFSKHLPLERLFRDARAGFVMAPTVDHLHDFVGRALTGLPLF